MSVKLRLAKTGRKHQISFRIVAQDTRNKRDGKFLEILGFYNPHNHPQVEINMKKVSNWIQKGAKPTEAVAKLLKTPNAERLTTNA